MTYQSHRFRVEEKKVVRKILSTLIITFVIFILLVFAGLPVMAKIIVFFSSLTNEKEPISNTTSSQPLFPPSFNPTYEATNTSRISVSGYGEKNATVRILVNNKEQAKTQTDNDGQFKALNLKLEEGTNNITAQNLLDSKSSTTSSPLYVVYKKIPPKLDINSPKDGDRFEGNDQNIFISGETDPGAKITVNDRIAIVDPGGKFNFPVKLNSGENSFKIISSDEAGNRVESELSVIFNPD